MDLKLAAYAVAGGGASVWNWGADGTLNSILAAIVALLTIMALIPLVIDRWRKLFAEDD